MFILAHILTLALIVLKLVGVIAISWWLVFLPSILVIAYVILMMILFAILVERFL